MTEAFNRGTMTVAIDRYRTLDYDDALFVYRTMLRIGHKKSLLPTEKHKYEYSPHFPNVFSFKTFNPPWFVSKLMCTVNGSPSFNDPLEFDEACIPQLRQLRSKISPLVLAKIHGLIAAFHRNEPLFAQNCIESLIRHLNSDALPVTPRTNPFSADTSSRPLSSSTGPN